jgi:hypothetical protein
MVRTEATDMDQARQLCIVGRERNGDLVGWRRGVEAVVVVTDGLHGRCWWQLGRGREVTVNWSLKAKWCVWFSPHPCPSWTTLSTALPCSSETRAAGALLNIELGSLMGMFGSGKCMLIDEHHVSSICRNLSQTDGKMEMSNTE